MDMDTKKHSDTPIMRLRRQAEVERGRLVSWKELWEELGLQSICTPLYFGKMGNGQHRPSTNMARRIEAATQGRLKAVELVFSREELAAWTELNQ